MKEVLPFPSHPLMWRSGVGARLEKVGQVWRRVKPGLARVLRWVKPLIAFALICLIVAGAILALYYLPKMQVPVCPPGKEGLPSKICFDIENEARKTLAYIMGGLLAIIGIYMAHRRIRALERQVLVAQEGQITERFTRAIEQLGSDRMEVRLGGIYALERIGNDSDKDYWPIMETLTAYVRERAAWRDQSQDEKRKASEAEPVVQKTLNGEAVVEEEAAGEEFPTPTASAISAPAARTKPATDIQAILTVLGRRKYCYGQGEDQGLDLRGTDLRGADLTGAHLEAATLRGAHLEGANLREAHLRGANLREAHLRGADLREAHLKRAYLEAHLEGADLSSARLEEAYLDGARLEGAILIGANLKGAILNKANLEGAVLWCAHLKGAYLSEAHLEGADFGGAPLLGATGLTREQLTKAILDEKTILPDYLQEESQGGKGAEGDKQE
jgi:hypothetical protein